MSRYEPRPVGVWDNDTQRLILPRERPAWNEYLRWLAAQPYVVPPAVPGEDPPPDPSGAAAALSAYRAARVTEVRRHAARLRARMASEAVPEELSWWVRKATEAARYLQTGRPADAPLLAAEAAARGVTLAVLANKVNQKAQRWEAAEARIAGVAGKHQDALAQLSSVAAIDAYDYRAGWPDVEPALDQKELRHA